MKTTIFLFLTLSLFLWGCEEHYIPKPRGYYRIELPKLEYKKVETPQFTFEILESSSISITQEDSSWTTINYPKIKASLYLTYFKNSDIETLSEDARKSAYKHSIKADDIILMPFHIPQNNLFGTVYSIEGNAASPVIFQFNDSIHQFVHGALYFNCEPNADSLKPVINFVKQDIEHIMETFRWKHQ